MAPNRHVDRIRIKFENVGDIGVPYRKNVRVGC